MSPRKSALIDELSDIVGRSNIVTDDRELEPFLLERRERFVSRAICAVLPASTAEVASVVKACRSHQVSIVPQGGNTGLCGGAVSARGSIIVNLRRLNRIRRLDAEAYTVAVEAGCVLGDIQDAVRRENRYFPLSLGAEGSCQVGGNLSTNAGGVNVLRYGNARDLTLGVEVVLANGEVWDGMNALRKDNTGYDLRNLFVGAEGTLGIITAAVLKLFPVPAHRLTAIMALDSVDAAVRLHARARRETSDFISSFELISRISMESAVRHIPGVRDPFGQAYPWYVLAELGDSTESGISTAVGQSMLESAFADGLVLDAAVAANARQADEMWHLRSAVTEAQRHEGRSIKNDVSVPISSIAEFARTASGALEALMPGIRCFIYGHIGDGNLHFNLCQPPDMDGETFYARWNDLTDEVNRMVHLCGGSFSAEHGIGLMKVRDMKTYKSETELSMMRSIKAALDPHDMMNPGKLLPSEEV